MDFSQNRLSHLISPQAPVIPTSADRLIATLSSQQTRSDLVSSIKDFNDVNSKPTSDLIQSAKNQCLKDISNILNSEQDDYLNQLGANLDQISFILSLVEFPVSQSYCIGRLESIIEAANSYRPLLELSHSPEHELVVEYESSKIQFQRFSTHQSLPINIVALEIQLLLLLKQASKPKNLQVQIDYLNRQVVVESVIFSADYDIVIPSNLSIRNLVVDIHCPAEVIMSRNSQVSKLIASPESKFSFADSEQQSQFLDLNPSFHEACTSYANQ